MRVSLPWARGEAKRDRREQCGEKNVRYFGTEVGREGVASQPVWPVRSGGTLVAHAWLCSFYLTKSDEVTTRAASAIRHHWTAWFNTFYIVAERVSYVTHISARAIKGWRVAHVCRTVAGLHPPAPMDNRSALVRREESTGEERWGASHGTRAACAAPCAPAGVAGLSPILPARAAAGVWAGRAALPSRRRPRSRMPRQTRRVWQEPHPWWAAPPGVPCGHRLRGARRACAWPPYRPRCRVASWPGWYGPRVPARPGDSPRPATRGAPHAS
jgi:hypothetical protein